MMHLSGKPCLTLDIVHQRVIYSTIKHPATCWSSTKQKSLLLSSSSYRQKVTCFYYDMAKKLHTWC
jgi:hypothetical protein